MQNDHFHENSWVKARAGVVIATGETRQAALATAIAAVDSIAVETAPLEHALTHEFSQSMEALPADIGRPI